MIILITYIEKIIHNNLFLRKADVLVHILPDE
jgi:hypothetical protein